MAVPSKFSAKQSAGEDAADLAAGPAVTTDEVVAIVEQMLSTDIPQMTPKLGSDDSQTAFVLEP